MKKQAYTPLWDIKPAPPKPPPQPVEVGVGMNASGMTQWRKRMGFSKVEAAEALGCSRNSLTTWEAESTKIPKYIGLACAALAFGIPAIQFTLVETKSPAGADGAESIKSS